LLLKLLKLYPIGINVIIPFPKKNKFLSLVGHIVFQKENLGQTIPFSENCVPNTNMTDKRLYPS
jgi:hypothetical protein